MTLAKGEQIIKDWDYATQKNSGGMAGRVKKTLEEMPQVTEAFVSHVEGMAVVKLAEAVENDVLKKIIEDQGYKVLDIQ